MNTRFSDHHPLIPVFLHNTFQRFITGNIQGQKLWCVIRRDKQHNSFFKQSLLKQFYAYTTTISKTAFFIASVGLYLIMIICYSILFSFTHLYSPKTLHSNIIHHDVQYVFMVTSFTTNIPSTFSYLIFDKNNLKNASNLHFLQYFDSLVSMTNLKAPCNIFLFP